MQRTRNQGIDWKSSVRGKLNLSSQMMWQCLRHSSLSSSLHWLSCPIAIMDSALSLVEAGCTEIRMPPPGFSTKVFYGRLCHRPSSPCIVSHGPESQPQQLSTVRRGAHISWMTRHPLTLHHRRGSCELPNTALPSVRHTSIHSMTSKSDKDP
jgi:hypothetical protein